MTKQNLIDYINLPNAISYKERAFDKFNSQIKTLEGNVKYLEETGDLGTIKILKGQISILKYMREELLKV